MADLLPATEGLTGRTRIDDAFARAGLAPEIAMSALDADVIKAYVELELGVGIIASMAFDPERDSGLRMLNCAHLFASSTSSLAIRRGRFLRGYVFRFIELVLAAAQREDGPRRHGEPVRLAPGPGRRQLRRRSAAGRRRADDAFGDPPQTGFSSARG